MSAGLNENIYMYFITINMKLQKKEAITFHNEQHGMSFTEPGFRRRIIVRIKLYIYTYICLPRKLYFLLEGVCSLTSETIWVLTQHQRHTNKRKAFFRTIRKQKHRGSPLYTVLLGGLSQPIPKEPIWVSALNTQEVAAPTHLQKPIWAFPSTSLGKCE